MRAKWKTANELYQWAKDEQLKAIEWLEKHYLDEISKDDKLTMCSKRFRIYSVCAAYLENIKTLDDKTVGFLYEMLDMYEDIDLLNISRFANVYESISFFKKSRLSLDGTRYKDEITRLKNNADELQGLSENIIKFRIPQLPHETLRSYVNIEIKCLDKDILKQFLNNLDGRERIPKETDDLKKRRKIFMSDQLSTIEDISDNFKYVNKDKDFLVPFHTNDEIEAYEAEINKALQELDDRRNYYTAKQQ